MKKIIAKIFFGLTLLFFIASMGLLVGHTFYSDHYFNTIHDFHNPVSEIMPNDKNNISVLMVSDTGSHNLILNDILQDALKNKKYDFVIHLGDFTKNASLTGTYWLLNNIKPTLQETPFYTLPGNHDITKRIGLSKKHFTDKSFYEAVMGPRYYWFGYGNTLFITLDSSDTTLDQAQLAWLEITLKKIRPLFKNCIILSHVPPINPNPAFVKDHILTNGSAERFEQIIKNYKINAMFFGHVHFYSESKFAGTDFYTIPSGGQHIRGNTRKYGYASVNIDKNGKVSVEPVYIEFHGKKKSFFGEWVARDVLSVKVRMLIKAGFMLTLIMFVIGLASYSSYKKSK